jgi:hypothetical protein
MNSLKELQSWAGSCGISSAGSKASILNKIGSFYHQSRDIDRVISIDMGTKNLAITVMASDFNVEQLKLVDLELPTKFDPQSFTKQIRSFMTQAVDPLLLLKGQTRCLIERQRCRTVGSRAIPESILRVNFVEILLHYHLKDCAISISPERVSSYYGLSKGREKKAAAVRVATQLIEDGKVGVHGNLRQFYENSRKQDDLSDSLLQARAFFLWRHEAIKFKGFLDQLVPLNRPSCI